MGNEKELFISSAKKRCYEIKSSYLSVKMNGSKIYFRQRLKLTSSVFFFVFWNTVAMATMLLAVSKVQRLLKIV